jgi:hypothetical protein
MFNTLAAMTLGIVVFAVLAVVGIVILGNLGTATAGCADAPFSGGTPYLYNSSSGLCYNATGITLSPPNQAGTTSYYLATQIGNGTGGLASYAPALIAVGVGAIFIGLLAGFMSGRNR